MITLPWINKPDCTTLIDVTSNINKQKFSEEPLDIEISNNLLNNNQITAIKVVIYYTNNNRVMTEELTFDVNKDIIPIKSLALSRDKDSDLYYEVSKYYHDNSLTTAPKIELKDTHLYIK